MAAPKENYDGLASFPDGINSGIDPTLLPKTQLAYAINATMRGTFIGPRPEFLNRPLTFDSLNSESVFQTGLWQGACFYKPDTGNEQLIASVAGRLFSVDIVTWAVRDISIAGDLNPAGATQAWLWQSERWVIVRDGISVPIIYDGVSSRRAIQFQSLGVVEVQSGIINNGEQGNISVLAPGYLGTIGQSVLAATTTGTLEIFQVVSPVSGGSQFTAILTSVSDSAGTTYPSGTEIVINPSRACVATGFQNDGQDFTTTASGDQVIFVYLSTTYQEAGLTLGKSVRIDGVSGSVYAVFAPNRIQFRFNKPAGTVFHAGVPIEFSTPQAPSSVAAVTAADFVSPVAGSSVTVTIQAPYTGADNAQVWIGQKLYTILGIAPPTNQATIAFLNNTGASQIIAANSEILAVSEIPPGRMGCYGMGRNWLCNPDGISYVASDIVGGPSGSANYDYRDGVLKMVENTFLAGGGSFSIPVSGDNITAMRFGANLDQSLGQGPLQIFVLGGAFSCNAPVDREVWQQLTNPIQTQSLISNGSTSHNATVLANSDIIFRSIDGFRSFIMARRDFDTHGNVPISREITRLIHGDASALLPYASAIVFDNRLLATARPVQGESGAYHTAMAVMNFDPVSTLRGKLQPIWEGEWTGLNIHQIVLANVAQVERGFAFHRNLDTGFLELREILKSADSRVGDVAWSFESAAIFGGQPENRQFQRLLNGEMWVDLVDGELDFQVFYRADDSTNWTAWRSWTEEASTGAFKPRMGLGSPSVVCDSEAGRATCDGYEFFIKTVITGKCQWKGGRFLSTAQSQPKFKQPKCQ